MKTLRQFILCLVAFTFTGCGTTGDWERAPSGGNTNPPDTCTPSCKSNQICVKSQCEDVKIAFGRPNPSKLVGVVGGQKVTVKLPVTIDGNYGVLPVELTAYPSSHKFTADVSPQTISESGEITISMTPDSSAEVGSVQVQIAGVAIAIPVNVNASVTQNDFTLKAIPVTTLAVAPGSSITLNIVTTVKSGDAETVNLAVTTSGDACAGITQLLQDASVLAGTSTILQLTAASTASPGSCSFMVTGTSASAKHTAAAVVSVTGTKDFTLAANLPSIDVSPGGLSTVTLTTGVPSGGVAETVTFSFTVSGSCAGLTNTFSQDSVQAGNTVVFSSAASSSAVVGSCAVNITGTSPSAAHTVVVTVNITGTRDFALSVSQSTMSFNQGVASSNTANVLTTLPSGGVAEAVTLSVSQSGTCTGLSMAFSSSSVTAGGSVVLTVSTTTATTAGTCIFTLTGTSPSATHTATVTVTVNGLHDFGISPYPTTLTMTQGVATNNDVTVATSVPTGGVAETVNVATSTSGTCTGITLTLNNTSVTAGHSVNLNVVTSTATVTGICLVTLTGTSPSATHTATVGITVTGVRDFSFTANPSTLTLAQSASGTSTVSTVVPTGGIAEIVNLTTSTTGICTGITVALSASSVTAGGSVTLTATTSASASSETCTITVTGTSPSATHTATVVVTVNPSGACSNDAMCGAGKVCNLATSSCIVSGSVSAMGKCTQNTDCQAGLTCVNDHGTNLCQAALCVSAGLTGYMCWPFTSADTAVAPTAVSGVVVFSNGYRSVDLQCCPNNGVFGSVTAYGSTPPTGCQGTGEKYTADLTDCHPIAGYTANGHQR